MFFYPTNGPRLAVAIPDFSYQASNTAFFDYEAPTPVVTSLTPSVGLAFGDQAGQAPSQII
jgi:hypothetical protein